MLFFIALCCVELQCVSLECAALNCIGLPCISLHCGCVALCCIAMRSAVSPRASPVETDKERVERSFKECIR